MSRVRREEGDAARRGGMCLLLGAVHGLRAVHRGWTMTGSAGSTAAALRAVLPQLPTTVVDGLDDDLTVLAGLLAELVPADSRHHRLVSEVDAVRAELTETLRGVLVALEGGIGEAAAALVAPTEQGDGAGAAPAAGESPGSRRAAAARARTRPRHSNKEIDGLFATLEQAGYGIQRSHGGHFKVYCPCGRCATRVFSSTPTSTNAARHDAQRLLRSGCHTRAHDNPGSTI